MFPMWKRSWISALNNRILKMTRIRDHVLLKLKKQPTPDDLQLYKKFRNRVYNEVKESKARFFLNLFSVNNQNMKKMWSGIKTKISQKFSTSPSIRKTKGKDRNLTSSPSKMFNIVNESYVNVADGITKTISLTSKSPLESNGTGNSLFLTPITLLEADDLINILIPSKSVGPNSIPIKFLKLLDTLFHHSLFFL